VEPDRKTAAQDRSESNVLQHQRRVDTSLQSLQSTMNHLLEQQSDHLDAIDQRFGGFARQSEERVQQLEVELQRTSQGLQEQCAAIREEVQQTHGDMNGCFETVHAQHQLNLRQSAECISEAKQSAARYLRVTQERALLSAQQFGERRARTEQVLDHLGDTTAQHVDVSQAHLGNLVRQVKQEGLAQRVVSMSAQQLCLRSFMQEQAQRSEQMQEKLLAGVHSLLDSFASTQRQMMNDACVAFQKQLEEHKLGR
jgi:hypothetical protein